jgi:hypothetical protein
MDVEVNKTFKDVVRDEHDAWSFRTNFEQKPQREDVAAWIKTAYDGIKPRTITKTWARFGLPCHVSNNKINIPNNNNNMEGDDDDDDEFGSLVDYLRFGALDIEDSTEEEDEADAYYI